MREETTPIITKTRLDEFGSPAAVSIINRGVVADNATLEILESIDEYLGFKIISPTNLNQVYDIRNIGVNSYYVNYNVGMVYFNKKSIGSEIIYSCYGTGSTSLSASRVHYNLDNKGDIKDTIESTIDSANEGVEYLKTIGDAVHIKNDLDISISNGESALDNMENTIRVINEAIEKGDIDRIKSDTNANKVNLENVTDGSFIQQHDKDKITSMINENKPVKIAILGDSTESGIGARGSAYGEMGDIQRPTAYETWALDLIKKSPFFIPANETNGDSDAFVKKNTSLSGILDTSIFMTMDKYFLSYGLRQYPTNEVTVKLKHLLNAKKDKMSIIYGRRYANGAAAFDVVCNGTTKTIQTFKDVKDFTTVVGVAQQGFCLEWASVTIPTDVDEFSVTINNVRQGLGQSSSVGSVNILGFYYGDELSFRNLSVRSTTLENDSDTNQSRGVTTAGRLNQAYQYGANVICMGWGTNDANISGYPLASFSAEYIRRINQIKANNEESVIILNSDYPDRNNVPYYEAVKKLCLSEKVSFFDMSGTLKKYVRETVMYDSFAHPNQYGQDVSGNALISQFNYNLSNSAINSQLQLLDKKINATKGKTIYMADFPKNTTDYGKILSDAINTADDYVVVCESNKEYIFTTTVTVRGRLKIVGNDSLWRFKGVGTLINFIRSPFMIEGSAIEDLIVWCGEKTDSSYQEKTFVNIEGGHVMIKFRNIKIYNFGYPFKMKDSDGIHTFGHSIISCSAWGFIIAVNSEGNAEQVLIDHCWFDDGKRTVGSQNACIRVTDATSFWIRNTVIQNCDIGILLKGVRNGEIIGNHFENMIDSSVYFNPSSAYDNRNTTISGNWLVGHKGCIRFHKTELKNIHTTIMGNCFGFVGADVTACITGTSGSEANTLMINNSKIDSEKLWYPSTIVTLKEFQ